MRRDKFMPAKKNHLFSFFAIRLNKIDVLFWIFLIFLFFLTRLIYLNHLPLFVDEAGYLRVAQIELQEPYKWLHSLQVGKQPLFCWATSLYLLIFKDPVISGRMVSVTAGLLTLVGLFFLYFSLFKSRLGAFLTSSLYIFYPFAFVYDRMAMLDTMVGMFAVWSIYITTLLIKYKRLDLAYTLGFLLGGGVLTKTNSFLNIYLLPLSSLLLKWPLKITSFFVYVFLFLLAIGVANVLYLIVSLSPDYQIVLGGHTVFIFTLHEFIRLPFDFLFKNFIKNFKLLLGWTIDYLTYPYLLLIVVSLINIRKHVFPKIFLVLYFLIPVIVISFFGKVLFPRYIYFATLALLPLIAHSLENIFLFVDGFIVNKVNIFTFKLILFIMIIAFPFYTCLVYIFRPEISSIPGIDLYAYTNIINFPFKESLTFFENQSKNNKLLIIIDGNAQSQQAVAATYYNKQNILIKFISQSFDQLEPEQILKLGGSTPSYIATVKNNKFNPAKKYHLELIMKSKVNGNFDYFVYRIPDIKQ